MSVKHETWLYACCFTCVRYKKDQEIAFLATQSLHNLLTACLLSESGPPLLDFEVDFVIPIFMKD